MSKLVQQLIDWFFNRDLTAVPVPASDDDIDLIIQNIHNNPQDWQKSGNGLIFYYNARNKMHLSRMSGTFELINSEARCAFDKQESKRLAAAFDSAGLITDRTRGEQYIRKVLT